MRRMVLNGGAARTAAMVALAAGCGARASAGGDATPGRGLSLVGERLQPEREPAAAPAPSGADLQGAGSDAWRVELSAWVWLTSVEGQAGVAERTADVSADFGDVLEGSDSLFAFSGRLEVGKGRWGGFVDGWYAKLGADNQSGPMGVTDIDVTFRTGIVNLGAMYRLAEWTPEGEPGKNRRGGAVDAYVGGRFTSVDLELDPRSLPSRSRSESWIDPIVGGRVILPLAARWHIVVDGDIGGFGVNSDLTWSATGVVGADLTLFGQPAVMYVGYRAVGWDYSKGSGTDQFTWDLVQHGPVLGLGVLF